MSTTEEGKCCEGYCKICDALKNAQTFNDKVLSNGFSEISKGIPFSLGVLEEHFKAVPNDYTTARYKISALKLAVEAANQRRINALEVSQDIKLHLLYLQGAHDRYVEQNPE